ncbi:MAG: hypothetical protein KC505_09825 [Myxococcales bacterium]|nr:hypothetical protein [Myxococcales bacterium]USN51610.1 MAG: hypothetical protein H6731_04155 [Myxococcales bacterium]
MSEILKNKVIQTLEEMALRAEILELNPFKIRAFIKAVRIIAEFEGDIKVAMKDGSLAKLSGIGAGTLAIIKHVLNDEPVPELENFRALVPSGVLDLTRISGLGPKRARMLWLELDIKNLGELEYAIKENRLQNIKGMGPKMQQSIAQALVEARKKLGHFRLDQLLYAAQLLKEIALGIDPHSKIETVGECSRACESSKHLEMLWLTKLDRESVKKMFKAQNIYLNFIEDRCEFVFLDIACHIYLSQNSASFGAETIWLSGDENFRKKIAHYADSVNFSFTQAGLYQEKKLIATPLENDVFDVLGIYPITRERRDGTAVFTKKGKSLPKLIELKDLLGAFHNHTTASDGINTLEEMRAQAIELGLSYLSINDHSQSAAYAHGLEPQRLKEQLKKIEVLNQDEQGKKCWLLSGTECDILADGSLDFPDSLLNQLDVVIASIHNRLRQDRETITARMLNAIKNPLTTMIGHPTGRLILDRPPSNFDMKLMLSTAKEYGTILELNANPHRLDLKYEHLMLAKEMGLMTAINPDAHSINGIKDIEYGVLIARKAGLEPKDVLNCYSINDIKTWLKNKKENNLS